MFWYLLLSKYSATTALFYALLLLQHTHITLLNTGLYVDLVRLLKQLAARVLLPRRSRRGTGTGGAGEGNNTVQVSLFGLKIALPMGWIVDKKGAKAHVKEAADNAEEGVEGKSNGDMSAAYSKLLQPMFFNIELAEQDNLADMTAIVSVSVLVTLLSMLGEAQFTKRYIPPRDNILDILWSLILMLVARFGSSRIVRFIMNFKARAAIRHMAGIRRGKGGGEGWVFGGRSSAVVALLLSNISFSPSFIVCSPPLSPPPPPALLCCLAPAANPPTRSSTSSGGSSSNERAGGARGVSYWVNWEHKKLRRRLFNGLSDSYVYFVLVSLSCIFACFQQLHTPVRYSFCVPLVEAP